MAVTGIALAAAAALCVARTGAGITEAVGWARSPIPLGRPPAPPPSRIVTDRWGIPLREFRNDASATCVPVPLDHVSPWMILATLAAEDRRFYTHAGLDPAAIARAVLQDARSGRLVSGASTLTQQLVRDLSPRPRSVWGKVAEMWRATRLERGATKHEILEAYLNRAGYGGTVRGVEAGARRWFGIAAADLTLAQAAFLAGIPKSPTRYDPKRHPDRARARGARILDRIAALGWTDAATLRRARAERVMVAPPAAPFAAPQFVLEAARGAIGPVLRTTLDAELQARLEEILRAHVKSLADHQVTSGALVALDNRTGDVLAWIGSAEFGDDRAGGQVDGVTALRQPGSALKPFLYALAIDRGLRASDLVADVPTWLPGGHTPRNYDESFHGPVRAREALACSYNIPAIRLVRRYGVESFHVTLRHLGFGSLDKPASHYGMGLALGAGEVRLLEIADAYATLARLGMRRPPRLRADEPPARGDDTPVLDPGAAWIVLDILGDNAARAAAFGLNSPLHLPFRLAAKTGTTKDYRDNWAAGATRDWTVAVWVGNMDGKPMRQVSGITGAAPVLRDAALAMQARYGAADIERPAGLIRAKVCPVSGAAATQACRDALEEWFTAAHPPVEACAVVHGPGQFDAALRGALANPRTERVMPGPRIEFPRAGDVFRVDPATPADAQAILLKGGQLPGGGACRWEVDGARLASTGPEAFWPLVPGQHVATLIVTADGREESAPPVRFLVSP